jgi:hypothetical protein
VIDAAVSSRRAHPACWSLLYGSATADRLAEASGRLHQDVARLLSELLGYAARTMTRGPPTLPGPLNRVLALGRAGTENHAERDDVDFRSLDLVRDLCPQGELQVPFPQVTTPVRELPSWHARQGGRHRPKE